MSFTLALAGCAGRPDAFLLPTGAAAPGTSRVDLFVATTRSSEGAAPGELFTGNRGQGLSFAEVSVSIPPDSARAIGEVQWPTSQPANPNKEFVTLAVQRLDQKQAVQRLNTRLATTKKRQVLVFVHGYNTRFDEAVYRFAQIVHDSGAPVAPVLFTWPSRGNLLGYTYDHESASYSRDALEKVLQGLVNDPAVGEVSVMAHSMGNWVTIEALRQLSIRDRGIPPKIKNVMLASPDVDADVFRRQIAMIEEGKTRPNFTLFVSRDDQALAASKRVWNMPRIGAIDPKSEPYRAELENEKMDVVDLTDIKTADSLNHGKFAESPEVVRMIGARLATGQAIGDTQAGIGETIGNVAVGTATTVGKAASVTISAPLAIVDGRTREGLSDQLTDLGSSTVETLHTATSMAH